MKALTFILVLLSFSCIYSENSDSLIFKIEGVVLMKEVGIPISGAEIRITDTRGNTFELETDTLGEFEFFLQEETSYLITVAHDEFIVGKGNETTVDEKESKIFYHQYDLQYSVCIIQLPAFYFELNSIVPVDSGLDYYNFSEELNYLKDLVLRDSTTKFYVFGSRSEDEKEELAAKRAMYIYETIKEWGVDMNRFVVDVSMVPSKQRFSSDYGIFYHEHLLEGTVPREIWSRKAGLVWRIE